MYAAKTVRGTCALYDPDREAGDRERLSLLGELGPAMRRDDLLLYYQPQVELDSGRPTGAEALVRWDRAGGDLLPPDRFVPEAEQTGLIHSLTHYVLGRALGQVRAWRVVAEGVEDAGVYRALHETGGDAIQGTSSARRSRPRRSGPSWPRRPRRRRRRKPAPHRPCPASRGATRPTISVGPGVGAAQRAALTTTCWISGSW